ncbi:hypothetical protein [Luteibacter sp.]|jgi:hypothetical protein|uniref:hypothetical protein n=1 Tax=Luteibacter sp. TaxID=1886636 RepID=UPI002F3ECBD3
MEHRFCLYLMGMALAVAIIGCSGKTPDSPEAKPVATRVEDGPTVAAHLQERYNELREDCGMPTRPAFLCSGILLRSTDYSPAYRSWLPNPATAAWGVSFSWLRGDSPFVDTHPTGNGFIVYPWFYADDVPGQYEQLNVRCIYPQDAWTAGPDRCREVCQDLDVTTAQQWLERYTDNEDQCAFGVGHGTSNSAHAWTQVSIVRREGRMSERNEVIVEAWREDVGRQMPLEAFFYRDNCHREDHLCRIETTVEERRQHARADQRDFLKFTRRWVPVIRWTPSLDPVPGSGFTYDPADQGVQP